VVTSLARQPTSIPQLQTEGTPIVAGQAAPPSQAGSPSPVPAQAATPLAAHPTLIPQLQTEGTPVVAGQPNDTPATNGQTTPPICAGTGMIGLVGLLLPMWIWRRRGI